MSICQSQTLIMRFIGLRICQSHFDAFVLSEFILFCTSRKVQWYNQTIIWQISGGK